MERPASCNTAAESQDSCSIVFCVQRSRRLINLVPFRALPLVLHPQITFSKRKSLSEVNIKFPLRVLHVGIGTKARLFLLRLHVACVGNPINRFPPNFSKFHLKSQKIAAGRRKLKMYPPKKVSQSVDRFTWKCRFYGCVNRQIDKWNFLADAWEIKYSCSFFKLCNFGAGLASQVQRYTAQLPFN